MPILEAKYRLGLFDNPYVDESKVDAALSGPEGLALDRKLAARSMVLLKNDDHTLPLTKNLKKVAVIGSLADSTKDIEGGWTVEGLFGGPSKSHPVTVLAGLKNKLGPNVQISYVAGAAPTREYPSMLDAITGAKNPSTAYSGRGRRLDYEGQDRRERCGFGGCRPRRNGLHERRRSLASRAGFARHAGTDA